MQYIPFGNLGFDVSRFGIGCMRLPTIKNKKGKNQIDEEKSIFMIRHGIDHGVNYIDTAWPYHGGYSESLVGKALADGYRERVYLATKSPSWLIHKYEDFESFLDRQLDKLKTDHIDFYLLHALNRDRWPQLKEIGCLRFLDEMVKKGKIKYPAFSFHDNYETFTDIIDGYDWKMAQIQMNLLDENAQATLKGLTYAGKKGVPVVVMEPLKGGKLALDDNPDIRSIYDQYPVKRSSVAWAFRWLYRLPEVTAVLSGVSSLDQLKENLEIFDKVDMSPLSEEESAIYKQVQEYYRKRVRVDCTACRYCVPCPQRIAIPDIFTHYNGSYMYNDFGWPIMQYNNALKERTGADACVECGACESQCPQHIPIIEKLKEAHKWLTQKR
jgi:predicted aldo/keto reductase-like oxidoreductase